MRTKFLKSAVLPHDFPLSNLPEIAIAGRSNAGKSSFINAVFQCDAAKVSQTPGKTTLLNFFQSNDDYVLVDTPGYGYAARALDQKESWTEMIETYMSERQQLCLVVLIMDVVRDWSEDEQNLLHWLDNVGCPMFVVLNKIDKLNQKELQKVKKYWVDVEGPQKLFWVSCQTGRGVDEVRRAIYDWIRSSKKDGAPSDQTENERGSASENSSGKKIKGELGEEFENDVKGNPWLRRK
jgi:GTP-binding protein